MRHEDLLDRRECLAAPTPHPEVLATSPTSKDVSPRHRVGQLAADLAGEQAAGWPITPLTLGAAVSEPLMAAFGARRDGARLRGKEVDQSH